MSEHDETKSVRALTKTRIGSIGSNPYLEVAPRLVWMRRENPGASLVTTLISEGEVPIEILDEKTGEFRAFTTRLALFSCAITLPNGASAGGTGSETLQDFRDYVEKAETKAIGRALDALGYSLEELVFDDEDRKPPRGGDGRRSNDGGGRSSSGGSGGGKPSQGDEVKEWRARIGTANAATEPGPWEELVNDAGTLPWKWIEMVKQAPSLEFVGWLDERAGQANQMTTALAGEIERRRATLKKAAG